MTTTWEPINTDQGFKDQRGDIAFPFYAEIGPASGDQTGATGAWSWTLLRANADGTQAELTSGTVASEEIAKIAAEAAAHGALAQFETAEPMTQAQAGGVEHILAAVRGVVFRSQEGGDVIVMLRDDNYAIAVDPEGDTASAYLVTVPPTEIAGAMDADRDEISGWSTGYDI